MGAAVAVLSGGAGAAGAAAGAVVVSGGVAVAGAAGAAGAELEEELSMVAGVWPRAVKVGAPASARMRVPRMREEEGRMVIGKEGRRFITLLK